MSEPERRRGMMLNSKGMPLPKEPGRSAHSIEQSPGIAQGLVGKWRKQHAKDGKAAFPDNGAEALTS